MTAVFSLAQMLLNLHKKSWMEGLTLTDYTEHCKLNEDIVKEMLELAKNYNKVRTGTTTMAAGLYTESLLLLYTL